jgi:hypothetical protein
MALYIGVPPATLHRWQSGLYKPDPQSCEKIAAWAGLPLNVVLEAAGHIPRGSKLGDIPPPPETVIEELGTLLRLFTPEEQRRIVLPAVRLVAELRDAMGDTPPTPPRPRRRPRPDPPEF